MVIKLDNWTQYTELANMSKYGKWNNVFASAKTF